MSIINRSLAIVIGIDQYKHIPKLKNAVADAQSMASVLKNMYGYEVLILLNQRATKEGLDELVTNLTNKTIQFERQTIEVKPTDRVLFYFAGHGFAEEAQDSEDGKPAGYFMPQDAEDGNSNTWLSMQNVYEAFTGLDCHHLLMILDCCFAGRISWVEKGRNATRSRKLYRQSYDHFVKHKTQQILTSAAHDEKAQDSFRFGQRGDQNGHSPFAHLLLKVLQGNSDGGKDKFIEAILEDKVITVHELFSYLQNQLGKVAEGQTPALAQPRKRDPKTGEYLFFKGEYLFPFHEFNREDLTPLTLSENTNPYKGLASFEREDNQLFFGRKRLIEGSKEKEGLLSKVINHPLIVVLGTSGSGKSSLVKAGLIPALKAPEQSSKQKWIVLEPMRPGESPFKALNKILTQLMSVPSEFTSLDYQEKKDIFPIRIDQVISPDSKVLLVVDQAEELFTLCQNSEECTDFINLLNQLLTTYPQQLRIVLTLRSEFEPQIRDAIKETHWQKMWKDGRFIVTPMNREELQQAIEEPAAQRTLSFESPKLVNDLIDEVIQTPGALPLLSFTLSELYLKYLKAEENQERNDRIITEADVYDEKQGLGGVSRSLTQAADKTYEELVKQGVQPSIIRDVMLRMVASSSGELARRRVPITELVYPKQKDEQAQQVIDQFYKARLLVKGFDTQGQETEGQEYVEPVHDVLVRGWPKIKYWLDEKEEIVKLGSGWNPIKKLLDVSKAVLLLPSQDGSRNNRSEAEKQLKVNLPLQRELTTAANNWSSKKVIDGSRQATGFLWDDDPRLPQLEQTQQSEDNWFNQTEAQFVERSITQKRWNIRIRWILVGTAFVVMSGIATSIWYQLQISQIREKSARVENLLQTDPVEGLALAIQAMGQNRSTPIVNRNILPEVQSNLLSAVQTSKERDRFQESGVVTAVAFSPDGQRIVSGNGCLRDLQGNTEPIKLKAEGSIYGISFSPDGTTIVGTVASKTATDTPQVQVGFWDVQGNPIPLPFQEAPSPIVSAAFSPDGETIVTGHIDGSVSLWNKQGNWIRQFSQKHQPISANPPIVDRVTFGPDGQTIFSHSRDGIREWNLEDGSSHFFPRQETDRGEMSDLSEGGDCRSTRAASPPNGFALYSSYFSFSRNNRYMIDSGHKNYLISLPEGKEQAVDDPIASPLAISPDATSFVGLSKDGSIMLRNVNPGGVNNAIDSEFKPVDQPFLSPNRSISNVAFSPDNKTIVTGGELGDVRIWDVRGINPVKQLQFSCNNEDSCPPIAISPDGQFIAIGDEKGNIKLLDSNSQPTGQSIETGKGSVKSLEFSPSGQEIIAKTSENQSGETWNIWDIKGNSLRHFTTDRSNNRIDYLALSPDGKRIIQTSALGITLLNSEGEPIGQTIKYTDINKQVGPIIVAFSPNGQQLVSWRYSFNGAEGLESNMLTCLWTVQADGLIPKEIPLGKGEARNCQDTPQISFAAFSPNGETVALAAQTSNNSQNTVSLWDLKSNQIGRPFQAPNVTSLAFSPDGGTIASTGFDGVIYLSNLQGIPIGRPLMGQLTGYSIKGTPQRTLAFSSDGKNLMSVYSNGIVQQWAIGSEQLLQVACNRLQYHPILNNPTTDTEKGARETCEKYVWNSSSNSKPIESSPGTSSIPTLPILPCDEPSPISLSPERPGYYKDGVYTKSIGKLDDQLTLILSNGDRYDGKFANNKRNGCGTYTFANGDRYVGEFFDDSFYGRGKYLGKDGNIYQGEFSNGRYQGVGELRFVNGDIYRGEFSAGECQGQGTLTLADGTVKAGEWQNGNLVGGSPNDSCHR